MSHNLLSHHVIYIFRQVFGNRVIQYILYCQQHFYTFTKENSTDRSKKMEEDGRGMTCSKGPKVGLKLRSLWFMK